MGELDDLVNQPYGALGISAAAVGVFPFSTHYIYSQRFFYRSNVPSHSSKTATSLLSPSDRARWNGKNWFSNRDHPTSREKLTSVTNFGVRRAGSMHTWQKKSSMTNRKVSSSIQQNTIRRTWCHIMMRTSRLQLTAKPNLKVVVRCLSIFSSKSFYIYEVMTYLRLLLVCTGPKGFMRASSCHPFNLFVVVVVWMVLWYRIVHFLLHCRFGDSTLICYSFTT